LFVPLFRRCLFRCFVAVIGRCFETKNDVNSETWQGMVAKFLNRMSGLAGLAVTRARIYPMRRRVCCKSRCICSKRVLRESRKAASGETRQPVFSLLIQAEQAALFEAWKRHWCGGQRLPTGTAVREV